MITLAYLYAVGRQDPNHDAIMRKEQGSKAAAPFFITAQSPCPTAEAATLDRHRARALPPQTLIGVSLSPFFYAAGRNITPSGISPVVAMRQSAMSSLRASATIIVLRVPLRPSAARARNH